MKKNVLIIRRKRLKFTFVMLFIDISVTIFVYLGKRKWYFYESQRLVCSMLKFSK